MIWYRDRFEVLRHAAAIAPLHGLVLEFGVASGDTIRCLAESEPLCARTVYGFDSFKGLPEPWGGYPAGHFARETPPQVPDNVELIIGSFNRTVLPFLATHRGDAALIHIDCDLYSSTCLVLDYLTPRIVPGTTVVLDEFYIVTDQEQRAFDEWLETAERSCRHEARSVEQLCVVMES